MTLPRYVMSDMIYDAIVYLKGLKNTGTSVSTKSEMITAHSLCGDFYLWQIG